MLPKGSVRQLRLIRQITYSLEKNTDIRSVTHCMDAIHSIRAQVEMLQQHVNLIAWDNRKFQKRPKRAASKQRLRNTGEIGPGYADE